MAHGLDLDREDKLAIGPLSRSGRWRDAANALPDARQDTLTSGLDPTPVIHFLALQCLACVLESFLHARGIEWRVRKRAFGTTR